MFIIAVNFKIVPGLMCCDVNIEHKNKLKLMLHYIKFYFVTSTHTFPQSQHLISIQDKDSQKYIFTHPFSPEKSAWMKANFLRESKMGKSNVFHPFFFFRSFLNFSHNFFQHYHPGIFLCIETHSKRSGVS